jgi:hypothetical protein
MWKKAQWLLRIAAMALMLRRLWKWAMELI